ncbi:Rha family transcriptional regulator [Stenotrophomonas panacihumi]|uniref:Rha family transcriptional regulator n=1 Tax=Stenotrophomonas panacihumi TaxID=676599 RepID=A0A0R0AZ43_9GAMM|nr:Rha family transcriptional regulator [Stenotrophomonas panacihumi]KRG47370.1 Rha family transcriptional regulator [Stenotrophomonas panacihumi]PTN55849.1 Rha family transcriptional regulator [Stenotrophomonas panacihumi]
MDANQIIDALGGTFAVARLCKVKPPSVSEWRRNNEIPNARLQFLRLARPDAFEGPPAAGQGVADAA